MVAVEKLTDVYGLEFWNLLLCHSDIYSMVTVIL